MIEVSHLTKRYGPVTAVDDVSFRVEAGEILGFLGPNGAGKTTTMRVITGYMPATEGQAIVAGHDVFADPLAAKRKIGYLPETPPLYPDMTVREYLTFVARLKMSKISASDCAMRVDHTMKKARVDDMANRHCGKLSKGYKQRVGIAQALIHDPEVLVLDEPTAGLDPKQIIETRDLIRSLAGNHTIVLSTHILPEVAQTCTRVVIINKGRVVAVDTPENLTHQLAGASSLYVQVEGPAEAASVLGSVPGVQEVTTADRHEQWFGFEVKAAADHDVRRDVAKAIVNKGWGLLELRPTRMSLEEIFLQLTTEEQAQQQAMDSATAEPTTGEAAHG
jgi:ABC-2 type transport system ATP-binding protein